MTGDVMLDRLLDQHQRRRRVTAVWGDVLDRLRGLDGLDEGDIEHAGAGEAREAPFEPTTVTAGDLDVAFFSLTDNTPEYAAGKCSPGTAYVEIDLDNEETRAAVRGALARARESDPDLLIASLHWEPNMVEKPSDSFEEFGRWLCDEGVGDNRLRNDRSFLFELTVTSDDEPTELRLVPTEIRNFSVCEAAPDAADWSRERMRDLSAPFGTSFERDGEHLVLALG